MISLAAAVAVKVGLTFPGKKYPRPHVSVLSPLVAFCLTLRIYVPTLRFVALDIVLAPPNVIVAIWPRDVSQVIVAPSDSVCDAIFVLANEALPCTLNDEVILAVVMLATLILTVPNVNTALAAALAALYAPASAPPRFNAWSVDVLGILTTPLLYN